jgi:hypothetical protein
VGVSGRSSGQTKTSPVRGRGRRGGSLGAPDSLYFFAFFAFLTVFFFAVFLAGFFAAFLATFFFAFAMLPSSVGSRVHGQPAECICSIAHPGAVGYRKVKFFFRPAAATLRDDVGNEAAGRARHPRGISDARAKPATATTPSHLDRGPTRIGALLTMILCVRRCSGTAPHNA